jgi:hypothetical protein
MCAQELSAAECQAIVESNPVMKVANWMWIFLSNAAFHRDGWMRSQDLMDAVGEICGSPRNPLGKRIEQPDGSLRWENEDLFWRALAAIADLPMCDSEKVVAEASFGGVKCLKWIDPNDHLSRRNEQLRPSRKPSRTLQPA